MILLQHSGGGEDVSFSPLAAQGSGNFLELFFLHTNNVTLSLFLLLHFPTFSLHFFLFFIHSYGFFRHDMLNCLRLQDEQGDRASVKAAFLKNSFGKTGLQLVWGKKWYTITRYFFWRHGSAEQRVLGINRWSRTRMWVALASICFSPCFHAIKICA